MTTNSRTSGTPPSCSFGLMSLLDRCASSHHGGDEALRFEGVAVDFRSLRDRCLRVANGLHGLGVAKGDRVAVLLRNSFEWVEVFFALAEIGAVCTPINVLLRTAEIEHVLEDAAAVALIVDDAGIDRVEACRAIPELVIGVGEDHRGVGRARTVAYDDLRAGRAEPTGVAVGVDDTLVLYYSSGTTGVPKAAVHTHGSVLWNSFHQLHDLRISRDEVYLVVPSLSWAAGFHTHMLASMWLGARSVLLPSGGNTVERVIDVAAQNGATRAMIVPTLLRQLLGDAKLQEKLRRTQLRWIVTGGEPVPLPMIEELQAGLPNIRLVQGYGLSEFPTSATILHPEEAVAHAGSAGRPTTICEMMVQTANGHLSGDGEGEVLIRSPATMKGYWNQPEQTAASLANGWLHTGDLGRIEGGFLELTGRVKDMIISGGLNVYPRETETVIQRIDGVREVAVMGVPDAHYGEVPVAVVVAPASVGETAVIEYCRTQLASYKTPRAVFVRDEPLPRNANGKVVKRDLEPWVTDHLSRLGSSGS